MTQAHPGWYPDPSGDNGYRWFDGQHWHMDPAGYQAMVEKYPTQYAPLPPRPETITVKGPNHALHAILTVCTFGMWLPVWIVVTIAGSKVQVTR